jgi:MFS family permease
MYSLTSDSLPRSLKRTCTLLYAFQGLLIVDVILLVSGVLSAIPVSADDSKIPGYPWLLICRFGVGFGAGGTAQS